MNNRIDRITVIEKRKLSSEFYFQSLVEQAHGKGLLTDADIERLQYECLNLLAKKTERYNAGDSTSIRVEKAQSIMTSNLFTIGLWLKTYANPDDAVTAIQNVQIVDLYEKGRKRIDTMIAASKVIHLQMLNQLIDTKNVFYRATIEDAVNGFFKLYYPDFGAHEIHITADYPVYNPMPKLMGIEFICEYLDALHCENQFCHYFAPDDIHHLLCGHAENYQELLMNIYEPILTTAIGCVIAGADARRLDISGSKAAHLSGLFAEMGKLDIFATIQNAARELKRVLNLSHGLDQYVQNSLPLISDKIETAKREKLLDHIFCAPDYPENKPKLYFSFGEKMDDEQYRRVLNQIIQCKSPQDKMAVIKNRIHSLADLEDILLDADLAHNEMEAILGELSLPEIAALSKKYFILSETAAIEFREKERVLRACLHNYVSSLPQRQREMLEKTSEAIEAL